MPDISDFLGFLRGHEGARVGVELGQCRSVDEERDRPLVVLDGTLGVWDMVDDVDHPSRGLAWVPVSVEAESNTGFFIAAHRAVEVVLDGVGGEAYFDDGHYIAVVPYAR
jgi:hypothetical protein